MLCGILETLKLVRGGRRHVHTRLLNVLRRTGGAIRDDGRWFCTAADVDRIRQARQALGAGMSRRPAGVEAVA
jgi:hypothetical protein